MDNTIASISTYASELDLESIPLPIRRIGVAHVLDSLACAMGATDCRAAQIGRDLAPPGPVHDFAGRVVGSFDTTTADTAAFINTAMIRYLDYNDTFPGGHPSDCLGALLSVAGGRGSSGAELLRSMIVNYEVYARLSESGRLRYLGWDQGAAVATSVSAGLGNLLGLSRDQIAHATALSTAACVPLRVTRAGQLSLWKGAATAHACREAVFLTGLAARGMTGPLQAFEGRHGLWEMVSGPFQLRAFPPEGSSLMMGTRLKYWPVEYNIQIAVWAALDVRKSIEAAEMRSIHVRTNWSSWHETASEPEKWRPQSRETADHSLPYVFARAFHDGEVTTGAFDSARFHEPHIHELMDKITVTVDDEIQAVYPETVAIRVDVETVNGEQRSFQLKNPRGHEANPMTAEEISAKFRSSVRQASGDTVEAALDFWWGLEDRADIGVGLDLLADLAAQSAADGTLAS